MTDLTTRVFSTVPGWAEARDRLDQLTQIALPVARAESAVHQVVDDILADLAAGSAPDVLAHARTANLEVDAVTVGRAALERARQLAKGDLESLIASHPDDVLAGLDRELQDLVDQVREFAPLHEVATEPAAIASDRSMDFKRLRSLSGGYAALRALQLRTLRDSSGGDLGTMHPISVFLAEVRQAWPHWAAWHSHGVLIERETSRSVVAKPEWPHTDDDDPRVDGKRTLLTDAARPQFLLWAVENDVQLWVPDRTQLAQASQELHAALADRHDDGRSRWVDPGALDVRGGNVRAGALR